MTVCVAAIADYQGKRIVIGVSDRMVTAGDIEFEQEQAKIHTLTSAITIMVAGDLAVQTDVLHELQSWVTQQIADKPTEWLRVKAVAEKFNDCLIELRKKAASNAILAPLGLDYEKLVSNEISNELALQLSKEVLNFQTSPTEAIVMGLDTSGTHIYVIDNNGVTCQDWTGFASIGSGAWHANSQLMFAGHVKTRSYSETIMLAYTAKRRAEVAPGVGEQTDMIVLGPDLGNHVFAGNPLMGLLATTYEEVRIQAEKIRSEANAKIGQYFAEVAQTTTGDENLHAQGTATLEAGPSEGEGETSEETVGEKYPN